MHGELASSHRELYLTCSDVMENQNSQTQVVVSYIPLPLERCVETHSEHPIDKGSILVTLQEREAILLSWV
jgi:hypothetical protein